MLAPLGAGPAAPPAGGERAAPAYGPRGHGGGDGGALPLLVEQRERLRADAWIRSQGGRPAPQLIGKAFLVSGALDVARLSAAAEQLVSRHAALRARFPDDPGGRQRVVEAADVEFDAGTSASRDGALSELRGLAARPLDLAPRRGPVPGLARAGGSAARRRRGAGRAGGGGFHAETLALVAEQVGAQVMLRGLFPADVYPAAAVARYLGYVEHLLARGVEAPGAALGGLHRLALADLDAEV